MNRIRKNVLIPALTAAFLAAPAGLRAQRVRPDRLQYLAVLMDGKKIGYAIADFKTKDGKACTHMKMVMTVGRGAIQMTIEIDRRDFETIDGKPLSFAQSIKQGPIGQTIEGRIDQAGKLHVTTTAGGQTRKKTVDWPKGAVLEYGGDLITRKAGLKPGTTVSLKTFDAMSLSVMNVAATVAKKKKVDLLGRVVMLTEINAVVKGRTGSMTMTTYVDDDHNTLKTVTPMMGMKLELVECSKRIALGPNDSIDLFSKFILASPVPLENLPSRKSISYTIAPTSGEAKLSFPTTDNQTVKQIAGGRVVVTVAPAAPPTGAAFPYTGSNARALKALKSTQFIQCDDKTIKDLARRAVGSTRDAGEAVKRIQKFVGSYIDDKNLSVGYASALEVAQSREGDCSEHAVLVAALCRAVGIPAEVVNGVVYVKRLRKRSAVFGPHAWNRALVGDKWVGLDAALEDYDAGHIALVCGDANPDSFLGIVNTLGLFRIVAVSNKAPAGGSPARPAPAPAGRHGGAGRVHDAKRGFSIVPPPGWRNVGKSGGTFMNYSGPTAAGAHFAVNFNVKITKTPGLTAREIPKIILQLHKFYAGKLTAYKPVQSGRVTIDGRRAGFMTGAFKVKDLEVRNHQFVIVTEGGRCCWITFTCPTRDFARNRPLFEKTAKSARID